VTLATSPFEKIKESHTDSPQTRMSNLKSLALAVLELLAFNGQKFRGSRDPGYAHFRGCSKTFYSECSGEGGKLCSKFGEDRSKTELTMLAVIAGWTDTGRTDAEVNLYSVQCCRLHWTHIINGITVKRSDMQCEIFRCVTNNKYIFAHFSIKYNYTLY